EHLPPLLSERPRRPPDLPSFPTRRSSDLTWQLPQTARRPSRPLSDRSTASSARGRSCASATTGVLPSRSSPRARSRSTSRSASADRKSHTSELQSRENLVCRLLLEKKKTT